jgi:protein SCO1/2
MIPSRPAAILLAATLFSLPAASAGPWLGKELLPAREAPPIELQDQNGAPFQLSSLCGKVVLVAFGFTCCPNICPVILSELAAARRALPPEQRALVNVMFISVDERDTAESLKQYLPLFDDSFTGLTGPREAIASVVKSYGGYFRKDERGSHAIDHSTDVYLIDPAGKLRAVFQRNQLGETAALAADIARVFEKP